MILTQEHLGTRAKQFLEKKSFSCWGIYSTCSARLHTSGFAIIFVIVPIIVTHITDTIAHFHKEGFEGIRIHPSLIFRAGLVKIFNHTFVVEIIWHWSPYSYVRIDSRRGQVAGGGMRL